MPSNSMKVNTSKSAPVISELLPEMAMVESKIRHSLTNSRMLLDQMGLHLLSAGGKRVRPLLALCAGRCFGPTNPQLISVAAAAELIHMASLVHDDIIDYASSRRGKPTLNVLWGNHPSVLAGDFLFAKAFELLCSTGFSEPLKIMVNTIQLMCQGEIQQAANGFDPSISEEEYLDRISKKTAVLLAASCQAGAITTGANSNQVQMLQNYGSFLGMTYQIIDDILDLTGQESMMGKPSGQDLTQGNLTLPLILLLRDNKYSSLVEDAQQGESTAILEALQTTGAIAEAYQKAKDYAEKAKESLHEFPDSPYKEVLSKMPDLALSRKS